MRPLKMELVVVGPEDNELRRVAKDFGTENLTVKTLVCPWGNRNLARNLGFQQASGQWVYFMDQDVRVPLGSLEKMADSLRALGSRPESVFFVGAQYISTRRCSYWGRCYNWLSNVWLESRPDAARFLAGNVILRKAAFSDRPFNQRLLEGGEEIDLCSRVSLAGGSGLHEPNLRLEHHATHDFTLFWSRLLSHARLKRRMTHSNKSSRLGRAAIRSLLSFPLGLPGLLVMFAAQTVARFSPPTRSNTSHVSESGYTIVELLVAAGLGSVAILAASVVMTQNITQFMGATNRLEAEEQFYQLEAAVKRVLHQAVLVRAHSATNNEGWIRPFADPATIESNGVVHWGLFQREVQTKLDGAVDSTLRNTGLFFIRPQASGGIEYPGVLIIDTAASATGTVVPNYNDTFGTSLVTMSVPSDAARFVRTTGGDSVERLASIDVDITIRYFPTSFPKDKRCFRPTGCASDSKGHDIRRVFTVLLRNNSFGPSHVAPSPHVQRSHRDIYFFQLYRSEGSTL
jgi:type II secretory pathway pseudopilin PulG